VFRAGIEFHFCVFGTAVGVDHQRVPRQECRRYRHRTVQQTARIIAQIKQQKIEAAVVSVKDGPEAIALLESGNADGFASDKLLLVGAKFNNPDAFMMLPDDLSVEPYGIGLPRGDWAFRLAVNTGLAQIFRSGTIVNIFAGWFTQIGLQMSPVLRVVYGLGALSD
jgi:ABC-type amino acid transport substrate-binding protein